MALFLLFIPGISAFCSEPPPIELFIPPRRRLEGPPVDEPEYSGIKIVYEFETIMNETPVSSALTEVYIPAVIEWYSHIVHVLKDSDSYIFSDYCGDFEVPESLKGDVSGDLALIITYSDIGEFSSWAQVCEVSPDQAMRPVLGRIHLQGANLGTLSWEQMFALLAHQFAHVLVFNANLLAYFADELGENYGLDHVLGTYYRRNHEIQYIKSPKTLEFAREAFGCNSLHGVDLEDSLEALGSLLHWDKRVMFNDFMVGDTSSYYISYSDITFGVFEDSGWYKVDWDYTSEVFWGHHRGCAFLLENCIQSSSTAFDHFCNMTTAISYCDPTHTYKGMCNLQSDLTIPYEFQYFDDPTQGGGDSLLDFCPVVVPYDHGSCRGLGTYVIDEDVYGEKVCEDCRCLEGTYVHQLGDVGVHFHAGCHEIECEGTTAVIHIGDEIAHCTPEGGTVSVRGYFGHLVCPESTVLCKNLHCVYNCYGRGRCIDGKCICHEGYSGDYCEDQGIWKVVALLFLGLI